MTRPEAPSRPRAARRLLLCSVLTVLHSFLCLRPCAGALSQTGQWTPTQNWVKTAIHMALLPGDLPGDGYPDHSRILWWTGEKFGVIDGGQWGWSPGSGGCDGFPSASFKPRGMPPSGVDIFCAGNAQVLGPQGQSQLFVPGGTDPVVLSYGEKRARIFTPGPDSTSGTWTAAGEMQEGRWYPSVTALKCGRRALVTSGYNNREHLVLWGRRNSAAPSQPTGDLLYRFSATNGGRWDPAQLPEPDPVAGRPLPRVAHSAVQMSGVANFFAQVYFGGRDSANTPHQDTWFLTRVDTVLAPDYKYRWAKRPLEAPQGLPLPRSEHTAVIGADTMVVVYGGLNQQGQSLSDVWRLFHDKVTGKLTWRQMDIDVFGGGPGPGARRGHAAIADTTPIILGGGTTLVKRMVVFGGTSVASPSDPTVWELRFDPVVPNHATWYAMAETLAFGAGPRPAPRLGHAMVHDPDERSLAPGHSGRVAFLYGGELGGGAYSDTLWALWILKSGKYAWQLRTVPGPGPGNRARHSMIFDEEQGPLEGTLRGRIYVLGGDVAGAPASRFVHELDPWAVSPQWAQWDDADFDLTGHTAVLDQIGTARIAEVYDAVSGQWQAHPNAMLLQPETYPTTFVVPGAAGDTSRVVALSVSIGSGIHTYRLDIPGQGQAGPWQRFPNGAPGIIPEAGVMYRPGQILIAQGGGLGLTKTLDATNLNAGWQNADTMQARSDHNLVLLPDGKVLVVGGGTTPRAPQIWDPTTREWGAALAMEPVARDYHSTAILLPTGEVLSAGGSGLSQNTADIFCPPYLFSGDTLATRPPLTGAPQRVRYGEQFSICMAASPLQSIASACLVRPGATTHAFDQNERYVPLTFAQSFIPPRLVATAPSDSAAAPPGDYLVFIVNSQGVPAVARWVRLGTSWPTGDVTAPAQITDLQVDMVATNGVNLMGTVTGDDGTAGTASYADLRYSTSPITEGNWSAAQRVTPAPVPACSGQLQSFPVSGLAQCQTYWFAIKFGDESGNWSAIGDTARAVTLCGGCCSGEARASLASDEERSPGASAEKEPTVAPEARGTARSTSASPANETSGLIVQALPGTGGLDLELIAIEPSGDGSDLGGVLYQTLEAGVWSTRLEYEPLAGDRFALCAPERPARWVFRMPHTLAAVPPVVGAAGALWQLDGAHHSRAGDVTDTLAASGTLPALAPGDTLAVHYAGLSAASVQPPAWLALLDRTSIGPAPARAAGRRPEATSTTPAVFALHQNQPNPFARATTIRFDLPVGAMVRLQVFDLLGRRVATLANRYYPPGYHSVEWGQRDAAGTRVGPGTYFYRIEAAATRDRKKMVLLP